MIIWTLVHCVSSDLIVLLAARELRMCLFQLLGVALLAIGIYVQVESTFDMLQLSSVLTSPAIAMIILGGLLFILGFCGCLGALLEVFLLLVAVSNGLLVSHQ